MFGGLPRQPAPQTRGPPPPGVGKDPVQLLAELLLRMSEGTGAAGLGESGKSLRRLHRMQARVPERPTEVIDHYLLEAMGEMEVTEREPLQPWQRCPAAVGGLQRIPEVAF